MTASGNFQKIDKKLAADFGPGLILVAIITASAYGLRQISWASQLSPMITAILVGMIFGNVVGINKSASSGITLSGKRLLRIAVALLGLQISYSQLSQIGLIGVVLAALVLTTTFVLTLYLGRLLGVDRKLTQLIAAGTSVCGASAIAAASATIRGDDEDVAYAVACITLFGTIAMFIFPLVGALAEMQPLNYGLWIGLSVHEVAQVVGAGYQVGSEAGDVAVVTKLSRVVLLAPLIVCISLILVKRDNKSGALEKKTPLVPFFVVGFLVLALVNSLQIIPSFVRDPLVSLTPIMLTAAMGALGLGTNVSKLKSLGWPPLILACIASIFIAIESYVFVAAVI